MSKLKYIAAVGLLALAACSSSGTSKESKTASKQLSGFLAAQPVPIFNWSQLRQNLIELETAQANTTATTSFFFNQGVQDPIASCPSIGFPIPSTYQLTNPTKAVDGPGTGNVTIAQIESTGVYTADTSGTYVICIDNDGKGYAFYWEGFVSTVTGPATWDDAKHTVTLTGAATGAFSTEHK